ncbi:AAA family ATPase [Microtetraspora malaysiensis]|uniref:AAA family ATPase n=1 Tax=Microtetraspora malaysiensis TaxID=161358 RepID=UPI0008319C34|nr:AAA family ATPase [Microtetraspora malaysiensis]
MLLTRIRVPGRARDEWPFILPAVRMLSGRGLRFTAGVTFFIGENGSGKSTIVEAIADACGINAEGGKAGTKYASRGPTTMLGEVLDAELTVAGFRLLDGPRLKRRGFFFRVETLFNLAQNVSGRYGFWEDDLTEQSHGEGFFTVLDRMVSGPGLYLMDEPEAALSFSSCLQLMGLMDRVARQGGQIVCATHSPILGIGRSPAWPSTPPAARCFCRRSRPAGTPSTGRTMPTSRWAATTKPERSVPDGVREVREELGLDIAYWELQPLGIRQTAVTLDPGWVEREFQYWHLLPLDASLEEIPLDDSEVSGLVQIDLSDAIALAGGDRVKVAARYLLRTEEGREYVDGTLSRDKLIPGYLDTDGDQLYLRLFIAAHRYLGGERTHLFW